MIDHSIIITKSAKSIKLFRYEEAARKINRNKNLLILSYLWKKQQTAKAKKKVLGSTASAYKNGNKQK